MSFSKKNNCDEYIPRFQLSRKYFLLKSNSHYLFKRIKVNYRAVKLIFLRASRAEVKFLHKEINGNN